MTTRESFDQALHETEVIVVKLGALVLQDLGNIQQDMKHDDSALACEVIASRRILRAAQRTINYRCATTIALQTPVARDMRRLVVMERVGREWEQMGSRAVKIARHSISLKERGQSAMTQTIDPLMQLVFEHAQGCIQAFVERNAQQALDLFIKNQALEAQCWEVFQQLEKQMEQDSSTVVAANKCLLAANELDGIREHMITICEQVIYLVEGDIPALA